MQDDVARRLAQVAEAEQAVLAQHHRIYGAGPYEAIGRVGRGC